MCLRAIRAAERGRDGGIGIAGKSAPKPAAAPRPRPPSASPVKTGFYMPPLVPHGAQFPMATPLPFPGGHSVAKASRTPLLSLGSAVARLFSAGLGIARPLPRPILSSLLRYSHSLFSSSGPRARPFSHTNHSFPSSSVFPNLPFLPNLGRPLCAPSLPALPGFPQTFAPRELSLRYQRSLGIAQLCPFPPSSSSDPSPDHLSSFVWRILTERQFCFSWQRSPLQITYLLSSPLQITYLLFLSLLGVISHLPEGKPF